MKSAKLQKYGKGWQLIGEKTITVSGDYGLTDDMDGQLVEFDNTGGPVKSIRFNGKDYTKQQKPRHEMAKNQRQNRRAIHHEGHQQQNNRTSAGIDSARRQDPARAPYNFVPLNEEVVPSEEDVKFDAYSKNRLSGYINLEIEALTDIFVRGQLEKFFSVNGNFAIPGSSLRGLIRSLVEIVSYSKMEMLDKKRKLFFRNIGDPFYKKIFLDIDNYNDNVRQKSKAGWLTKEGSKYFLQEVSTFYKVNRNILTRLELDLQGEVYKTIPIWFDPQNVQEVHEKEIRRDGIVVKRLNLYYNKIGHHGISKAMKSDFSKATLLITGLFGSAKHFQWIIPEVSSSTDKVDVTTIMQEYQLDESRDEKADLIKALRKANGKSIPCFFISDEKNGNPVAIGHTGIFRHPYKYEIGHAVKQKSIENPDITKAIFGYADTVIKQEIIKAGKVFFEDAYANESPSTEFGALKILSSPKPTSFQLYLEQSRGEESHWGSENNKIRGHKFYWHSQQDWRNPEVLITAQNHTELISKVLEDKTCQHTLGEVLKSGSRFHGRIRFENLTRNELGAILFALDLPEGCAHKLGMGKSLGLGSVKITPSLVLIQRRERYTEIFDENGNWTSSEKPEPNTSCYKDEFALYIAEHTQQKYIRDAESYWVNDIRLNELKHLLTFQQNVAGVSWENRTRYMLIEHPSYTPRNEYRDGYTRHILPKPSEVVQPETYRDD